MRVFAFIILIISIHVHQGIALHKSLSSLRGIDTPLTPPSSSSSGISNTGSIMKWVNANMDQISSLVQDSLKAQFQTALSSFPLSIQHSRQDRTMVFQIATARIEVSPSSINFNNGNSCFSGKAPSSLLTPQLIPNSLPTLKYSETLKFDPVTPLPTGPNTGQCQLLPKPVSATPLNPPALLNGITSMQSMVTSLPKLSLPFFALLQLANAQLSSPNDDYVDEATFDSQRELEGNNVLNYDDDADDDKIDTTFIKFIIMGIVITCFLLILQPDWLRNAQRGVMNRLGMNDHRDEDEEFMKRHFRRDDDIEANIGLIGDTQNIESSD